VTTEDRSGGNVNMIAGASLLKPEGEISLSSGLGASGFPSGAIRFLIPSESGEKEVLRIDPGGGFYVNGNLVEEDALVYASFRRWLTTAIASRGAAAGPKPGLSCFRCSEVIPKGVAFVGDSEEGGVRHPPRS